MIKTTQFLKDMIGLGILTWAGYALLVIT